MEHMQDLATQNPDRQKEMAKKLEEGKLSIRDWREQIQNVMNLYVAPIGYRLSLGQTTFLGDLYPRLRL